jgi:hypothetical protein
MPSRPHGLVGPVTRDARAGRHGAWSSRSGLARWHGHRQRAGALGDAGPRPRVAVLLRECTGRPKDGGSSLDRGGDVEAEDELRLDGAPTTTVASGGPLRSATHPAGQRDRGEARRVTHLGKGGERWRRPNLDG